MNDYKPSAECFALVAQFEGNKLIAYRDQKGIPTDGVGHTAGVHMGDSITLAQSQQQFNSDITERAKQVNAVISSEINQNIFDACCSFVFNEGIGNFMESILLRLINQDPFDISGEHPIQTCTW